MTAITAVTTTALHACLIFAYSTLIPRRNIMLGIILKQPKHQQLVNATRSINNTKKNITII